MLRIQQRLTMRKYDSGSLRKFFSVLIYNGGIIDWTQGDDLRVNA